MEGRQKDLNPAILNAVDRDAPADTLSITILNPPTHGTLLSGIHGFYVDRHQEMMGTELLKRGEPVDVFTIQELQQGEDLFRPFLFIK